MASTPYCAFISGLMKRQPIVVSKISAARENASPALPVTNGARGVTHRIEAGGAQPVHGDAGDPVRQPGQQQRHACDIAVVLAGLVGAAEKDFIQPRPVGLCIAGDQRLERDRGEIVGPYFGERTAVAADRGAHRIANKNLAHRPLLQPFL
jgi:hypothetical protein